MFYSSLPVNIPQTKNPLEHDVNLAPIHLLSLRLIDYLIRIAMKSFPRTEGTQILTRQKIIERAEANESTLNAHSRLILKEI